MRLFGNGSQEFSAETKQEVHEDCVITHLIANGKIVPLTLAASSGVIDLRLQRGIPLSVKTLGRSITQLVRMSIDH